MISGTVPVGVTRKSNEGRKLALYEEHPNRISYKEWDVLQMPSTGLNVLKLKAFLQRKIA